MLEGEVREALGIGGEDSAEGMAVHEAIRSGILHGITHALVNVKARPPLAERVAAVQAGGRVILDDGELLDELRRMGYRPPGPRKATPEQIARHHAQVAARRAARRAAQDEGERSGNEARWRP